MAKKLKKNYTNGFSVSVNPTEGRILCFLTTPVIEKGKDTGNVEFEDIADIRMSMLMLKQLSGVLGESIKKYEEQFGEIIIPKNED